MKTVLIVDDQQKIRELLARIIALEGFDVLKAADCASAWRLLEIKSVEVVICDVKLPDGNGVDFTGQIKKDYPAVEVILLTAYGNIPDGVKAIKNGAFDYITKGDDNNKIVPLVQRAIEKVELSDKVKHLEARLGEKYSFSSINGDSPAIQEAIALAKKVAVTDTSVLLTGETGTGKEVFAQAIHQHSNRANKHFVAINCAAISKEIMESELFGHKSGAFTGATKDKKGLFQKANQGTIFLDEMGEMPLDLQAKLLRVLESGEFIRVGDNEVSKVDVRIIAATNRDLNKEIAEKRFREDLFYRISVFEIKLPALRERKEDIKKIAHHFIQEFAIKLGKKAPKMSDEYEDLISNYSWRGNIRELKNVVERSVILCDTVLNKEHLPADLYTQSHLIADSALESMDFELASAEKKHIERVLSHTQGNKTKAASLLNIALTTLYRKISEYGL